MRRETGEENEAAISAIISNNLHGLELDPRCIQIATFALALEAWKEGFSPTQSYLPVPNLACTGIPITAEKDEWLKLAGGDGLLENALLQYYDLFKNADSLGSLIQIDNEKGSLVDQKTLMEKLEQALKKETDAGDPVAETFGETANAIMKAVGLLTGKYDYVMTNVPYLKRGKQGEIVKDFCSLRYPLSKNDIATVFLERCLSFCHKGGRVSIVLPQNWLFQTTYKNLRVSLLKNETWEFIVRLGAQAFQTRMWDFNVQLLTICHDMRKENSKISGIDVSEKRTASEKSITLLNRESIHELQENQLNNPDARISFDEIGDTELLEIYARGIVGIQTGDMPYMKLNFWEIFNNDLIWIYFQGTVNKSTFFSGNESIFRWCNGSGPINQLPGARIQGLSAWGKKGIKISQMGKLPASSYLGLAFDNNAAAIIPNNPDHLSAIWCYCSSPIYNKKVREIDQKANVTNKTLVKVPFDLEHWQKVAAEKYPNGLPKPYSDDPTQWLFHGHPKPSESPLHVAIARLLGYRWPAETDTEMELSSEARDWIVESKKLLTFADEDGIVCIPSVRGEGRMVDRVREILAASFGDEWSARREEKLLVDLGYVKSNGSLKGDLEKFLRDEFFKSHCKLFHNRPFIWHIWDGEKDGFSVLVNYHKLDRRNLERMIYSYLGPWISLQEREKAEGVAGAEKRLIAAQTLKEKLELILKGEAPYDIYVRWKQLEEQAIGWDPDINDGIRLNIRPFVEAGVLRWKKPSGLKWDKPDRGSDPVPNCSGTVVRHNDLHFTLEEKRTARGE